MRIRTFLPALAGGLSACLGSIGDRDPDSPGGAGTGGAAGTASAPAPRGAVPGAGGGSPIGSDGLCTAPARPGPVFLRRLTNAEYSHSANDLLGANIDAEKQLGFPADTGAYGFRNNSENGTIATLHIERYSDAAAQLTADLMKAPARRMTALGCDMAAGDRPACLRSLLQRFGRRAYRRPLTNEELTGLTGLAAMTTDPDPWAGASMAIEAMLQSTDFLYRVEIGKADPARPGLLKLSGYEVATRLSYLLRGTTPDDGLLDAAGAGKLDTIEGVKAAAEQMLGEPRARQAVQEFFAQWLGVEELEHASPDTKLYPKWNDALRAAMREETLRFTEDLVFRNDGTVLDLLRARHTFANGTLAAFYGVPPPPGGAWGKITFADGVPRVGFLTQGSFLTTTSKPDRASPTLRGRFVRDALLCAPTPDPPPNVDTTLPATAGLTLRQRLEEHQKNPACGGCHALMDPVGLGFEPYDAIGAFIAKDAKGNPVSSKGSLTGFDPPDFNGPAELGQRLLSRPDFTRCVTVQAFRYTFARGDTMQDGCSLDRFFAAFRDKGFSFRELLLAMVTSDAFRYRLGG